MPARPRQPKIPKEQLQELYVEQGLTARAIARQLGISDHGQVTADLRAYGIPIRSGADAQPKPLVSIEQVRRLYVGQRHSIAEVARRLGCGPDAVSAALDRAGIERRPATAAPEQSITREEFEELHHRQRLTIGEIAARYGTHRRRISRRAAELGVPILKLHASSGANLPVQGEDRLASLYDRRDVRAVLKRHRIPRRDWAHSADALLAVPLTRTLLVDLYERCGLSGTEIGLLLARANGTVMRALRVEGVSVRPRPVASPRPPSTREARRPRPDRIPLTADVLQDLYVTQELTLRQVADRCGYFGVTAVRHALMRDGIPMRRVTKRKRKVELTTGLLEELAVRQGLSDRAIASLLDDYSTTTIGVARRLAGIPTSRPRPPVPADRPELTVELLRRLYVDQRQRVREIERETSYPRRRLARELRDRGMEIETRRGRPRQRRREFDRDELVRLYVDGDMSAAAVGKELGVSANVVLSRLHDYGIPVRRNAWEHPADGRRRLKELQGDPRVVEALAVAGVPVWRDSGLPVPEGPLPAEFLKVTYVDLKLSLFDIELLTARTPASVKADLKEAGISVRPRRGYRGPGATQARRTQT